MSNLESVLRGNIGAFQQQISALQGQVAELLSDEGASQEAVAHARARLAKTSEAHVDYMLSVAPYVKQYFHQPDEQPDGGSSAPSLAPNGSGQCMWVVDQGLVQRKGSVFRKYMNDVEQQVSGQYADEAASEGRHYYDVCSDCDGSPCLILDREYMVCPACGRCYPMANMSFENLSFEQQVNNIVPIACYRRSNHFAEWLSKLQAREVTKIPDDIMNAVKVELKKQRLTEACKITQAKIKEILKKLKYSKYYEHVPSIHSVITKTSAPRFPPVLEDKLKLLFDEIQEPFERHKGAKRSNMLSYGFLLYKFCELLGEDEYLPYLPLLKSSSKLWECDQVWKKICTDRQWEYVPTV